MREYKLKLNKDGETGILTIIEDGDDIKTLTKKEFRFFEKATNGSYRKFYGIH